MTKRRISHAKGKGSINHNNRIHIYKNVDPSRTKDNIYYIRESLDVAYQKCFGEALSNYNTKQKRADRKIEDYFKHLFGNARKDVVATSTNKENSFYEIVVGVGDKNTCAVGTPDGITAAKILDEYARGFSERNPNFYVFNSVLHLDEQTPHLHIDYVPVAHGYKSSLETRNSQSVALQQMGFGKAKDSINSWRIQERQIIRELCRKYGLDIAEETKGRGKTFTPDEYKALRYEAKEELKADPDMIDEIKGELRADVEDDWLSNNQHLVDAVAIIEKEVTELEDAKTTLQDTKTKLQADIRAEKKNFNDMQTKFQPRKDDLDRVSKISREAKPNFTGGKVTLLKDDWDFLINLAKQHAKISDTTLAALESRAEDTAMLQRCQSLYLAVASEVAALGWSDKDKIKHRVQDVLRDIVDTRVVAWLVDDMKDRKPSDLEEILQIRQAKIDKKINFARKQREYNQPNPAPQKAKKKSYSHERD
ncbi:MAG: plasmid recombination protein [Defluviitaleaceae bacterium]|nr:plasmid recombination protein [Defluviitaleaceae bacterium]